YLQIVICFLSYDDPSTTELYTLSLHDALPIWPALLRRRSTSPASAAAAARAGRSRMSSSSGRTLSSPSSATSASSRSRRRPVARSEEHTSELQSRGHLVCRLLLEKKKIKHNYT